MLPNLKQRKLVRSFVTVPGTCIADENSLAATNSSSNLCNSTLFILGFLTKMSLQLNNLYLFVTVNALRLVLQPKLETDTDLRRDAFI